MQFETMVSTILDERCYALWDPEDARKRGVLIDPGVGAAKFAAKVRELGLEIEAIWQTHCHFDHCASTEPLRREFKAVLFLEKGEEMILEELPARVAMFGVRDLQAPGEWQYVREGDTMRVGGSKCVVLHTPGHTPGSVCYWFEREGLVFTGDTLFRMSAGRTDFPGGDAEALARSLERLAGLPEETKAYPGHGPSTTIGLEKKRNPFLAPEFTGGGWRRFM